MIDEPFPTFDAVRRRMEDALGITDAIRDSGRDIQPVRIEVEAHPPCGLSSEFGAPSQGRAVATIGAIPAGTRVDSVLLVGAGGDELRRFPLGRVIEDGESVGLALDSRDWRWSVV